MLLLLQLVTERCVTLSISLVSTPAASTILEKTNPSDNRVRLPGGFFCILGSVRRSWSVDAASLKRLVTRSELRQVFRQVLESLYIDRKGLTMRRLPTF